MKMNVACTAIGATLAIGAPVAHAQTVIEPGGTVVRQPVVETVQTVETVRPARSSTVTRRVVTTTTRRTVVRERVVPAQTVAAYPQPLYDYYGGDLAAVSVATAPAPAVTYSPPLYDYYNGDVEQPAAVTAAMIAQPSPNYRYIYQTDRILIVDPVTNVMIGTLPR